MIKLSNITKVFHQGTRTIQALNLSLIHISDKEFRYLRTVIVTAAVYRGFDQELRVTANPIN